MSIPRLPATVIGYVLIAIGFSGTLIFYLFEKIGHAVVSVVIALIGFALEITILSERK